MLRRRHGIKPTRERDFLGAQASRPHKSWHSLGHLLHPGRPAATPGLCSGRAHAVPAGRVAGCLIAGKLSGTQRECMRAGRPRSRVAPPPIPLAPRGGVRRLAGPQPYPCGRAVSLSGPSWFFVSLRGLLFFSVVSGKNTSLQRGCFQSRCLRRKRKVPSPWIWCSPANHSISVRLPWPSSR